MAYVAVIEILSIKFRQGTFTDFVLSDRNIMYSAAIGIAFAAASFLGSGGYGLVAGDPVGRRRVK